MGNSFHCLNSILHKTTVISSQSSWNDLLTNLQKLEWVHFNVLRFATWPIPLGESRMRFYVSCWAILLSNCVTVAHFTFHNVWFMIHLWIWTAALEGRLLDFDDRVRMEAVIIACDLARSNLKIFPPKLMSQTTERLRDKKVYPP